MAKATRAATTEVATTSGNSKLPVSFAIDPADAQAGFESAGKEAFAIPFLVILQSMSPQTKKSEGAYIKGAEEGMLFNTVTGELFNGDEGLEIIPCSFVSTFIEWNLRENGGGFIQELDNVAGAALRTTAKRDDRSRDVLPNGHQITDHRNHYVLYKDAEGNWQPILMSLTSTQIKASRNWMSAMQRACATNGVPMFALRYRITTVPQKNDKGSWFGAQFEQLGYVESEEVYSLAKGFYEQVKSGAVKVSPRDAAADTETSEPGNM